MKKSVLGTLTLSFFTCLVTPSAQLIAAEPKKVVTSFYPLAFITESIVGDKAIVTNLAGSVDVHAYTLSPQDLVKINKADLVVYQGAELEPWVDSVVPELKEKGVATLEVSEALELAKLDDHKDEHHDDHKDEHHDDHKDEHHDDHKDEHHDDHKDEHHDDHKGEHHDDHKDEHHDDHEDDHGHHHGEYDPHTWLDPVLAQGMTDNVLKAIVAIDPENQAFYQDNSQVLKNRFSELDKVYASGLANCERDEVIMSHDAYGYLADRYGFEFHTIAGISPDDEPSAKVLAELKKEAEEDITHLLIEENSSRRFADTLARETDMQTLAINPLGRGTLDPQKSFFDVMMDNLASLRTALNCQ